MAEQTNKYLAGKRFGNWTVVEDCTPDFRGRKMVVCKCDCGTVRRTAKSPFLHGTNSSKCFECHLKLQKRIPIATKKE